MQDRREQKPPAIFQCCVDFVKLAADQSGPQIVRVVPALGAEITQSL